MALTSEAVCVGVDRSDAVAELSLRGKTYFDATMTCETSKVDGPSAKDTDTDVHTDACLPI